MSDLRNDDWDDLPILLKVDEAMRVLRIPRFALEEFVTTGRIVQLLPQPDTGATVHATPPRKSHRQRQSTDRSQLSLLASD